MLWDALGISFTKLFFRCHRMARFDGVFYEMLFLLVLGIRSFSVRVGAMYCQEKLVVRRKCVVDRLYVGLVVDWLYAAA